MSRASLRRAIVTGASKGIGYAIAQRLAHANYSLLLTARSALRLTRASRSIAKTSPHPILSQECDLSDPDSIISFSRHCRRLRFCPHLLVLNAAMFHGESFSTSTRILDRLLDVNLRGTYLLTQHLLPLMYKQDSPRIVIIGSTSGIEQNMTAPLYSISKWSVHGLATNLRAELAPKRIGVTLLAPGGTLTDMWRSEDVVPRGLMSPADVAVMVHASDSLSENAVAEFIVMRPMLGDAHR